MQWEARTRGVESILVKDCVRTDKDKTGVKHWKGEGRYLKPNLAALRLIQEEDPKIFELVISTGNFFYEFRPQFKKLVVTALPAARVGDFENNLLSFMFGMTAADAKRRYDLTLAKDISDQNPHYIYINVFPRFEADKREFTRAQMVLFATTMLPRRLWFEHPNGDEVTWDLPNMDTKVQLRPSDFVPPQAPQGWETVKVPLPDPGPRIIRTGSDR
jgi:TIGR03009 family protein